MTITSGSGTITIKGEPEGERGEDLLVKTLGLRQDMLAKQGMLSKKSSFRFIVDSVSTKEFLLGRGVPYFEIIMRDVPKELEDSPRECAV